MSRILVCLLVFLLLSVSGNAEIKTISGIVREINSEYIFFETEDGNGWVIDYESGYRIGESVSIVFDDLGNRDLYDDEIIHVERGF